MAEEKGVVKYTSRDGQEITLTFDTIKKYLVQGNREAVTQQELMYFLGVCKSRGLNPFKKDAYLIKYGKDPAAIITSIDYFRSRARAQPDCRGWKCGVIVRDENGLIKDTAGLVLDGEKIVGGFFEAKPENWNEPMRLEVNLNGYIKKTKDGRTTRFWQAENQPTMISKVAESQGLRKLWPDEFQGIYEKDEIQQPSDIELQKAENGSYQIADEKPLDTSKFNNLAKEQLDYRGAALDEFLELTAQAQSISISIDQLKISAAEDFDGFRKAFEGWRLKTYPEDKQNPNLKGATQEERAMYRPETEDFLCKHCKESIHPTLRGLRKHITQSHPLKTEKAKKHFNGKEAEVTEEIIEPETGSTTTPDDQLDAAKRQNDLNNANELKNNLMKRMKEMDEHSRLVDLQNDYSDIYKQACKDIGIAPDPGPASPEELTQLMSRATAIFKVREAQNKF